MSISEAQRYGGSARQAEDSRRWHQFCSKIGFLHIRHEKERVILSLQHIAPPVEVSNKENTR